MTPQDAVDRRKALAPLTVQVAVLDTKVDALSTQVEIMDRKHDEMMAALKLLSDQWNSAQGAISLAKWLAGILTAAGLWTAAVKSHILGH